MAIDGGAGAWSIHFTHIQKALSGARVCTYDHAGLGWSDAGPACGASVTERFSADEQTAQMKAELERWTSWSPFRLTDCVDCKTLPQCHSGCAHIAMKRDGPLTHGDCSELKWNLPETVTMYYLAQARQQAMRRYIPLRQVS